MFVQTVALQDIKFFAFHGFYPEEQVLGNHFLVNVEVSFVPKGDTEDLQNTVNYEKLNEVVIAEMNTTQQLLETVVKNIIHQLIETYPFITTATVSIKKMSLPMPGEIGNSFVQLKYTASA
jgi:dihydroneopterin aldolase